MSESQPVAVTGARGIIGSRLIANLAADHDVRALDRANADLLDPAALEPALSGCGAVIHLAAGVLRAGTWDEVWDANLTGLRNLFEAACGAGCTQVVYASSLHVLGLYEEEGRPAIYTPRSGKLLDTRTPVRPGNPYAVTKACGEILARYYSEVRGLRVACVRIGSMNVADSPDDPGPPPGTRLGGLSDQERAARLRSKWFSHADFARLVCAILASDVSFGIVYGVGNNPGRFVDLEPGRALYGFWPRDGAGRVRSGNRPGPTDARSESAPTQ